MLDAIRRVKWSSMAHRYLTVSHGTRPDGIRELISGCVDCGARKTQTRVSYTPWRTVDDPGDECPVSADGGNDGKQEQENA